MTAPAAPFSSTMNVGSSDEQTLGSPIPFGNPHALSVSLPTWLDNVGWASGDSRVVDTMQTGYPRFFVARNIQELGKICLDRLGVRGKSCLLFASSRAAKECVSVLQHHKSESSDDKDIATIGITLDDPCGSSQGLELHIVTFSASLRRPAKSFWQHAGMGISSRYADACLSLLAHNGVVRELGPGTMSTFCANAKESKQQIRERIARLAAHGGNASKSFKHSNHKLSPAESDVFLYPSGMSAIWHAHQSTLALWPGFKSVCFGFPYTDTAKVLDNWGPGCHFYGEHPDANLAALKENIAMLRNHSSEAACPISAVFCEFPSNPLLQSPDLVELRKLADQHGFIIIIDDTIGNSVNVNVLPLVDIIATSLSKLFSGKADVMGGSLVLNPNLPHYGALKSHLSETFSDEWYAPDAIVMEHNSRDFASRVDLINANTRAVCHYLHSRCLSSQDADAARSTAGASFVIKDVFYPEWVTRANYDACRRPGRDNNFGPLFSLTFASLAASAAFYDALPCAKGPSLGTNFTLSCPYTLLAHYHEREWAAEYGVEEGIVRVSVGMEEQDVLMGWFRKALEAAEATMAFATS